MSKYLVPIRNLGGAALITLIIGLIFPSIISGIADERLRNGVLVQSIPFVMFFITVLLLFILTIMLVALRFNGKIPSRAYKPIEYTIIAGILGGVVALFQSFHFVGYKYGFVMLLGATLCFILWSHVVPKSAKADVELPKISALQHVIGLIAALVVVVLLVNSAVTLNAPKEPYGVRQRVWNSYDDARKAEIRDAALADFNSVEAPFLVLFNMLPGLLIYFAVRELTGAFLPKSTSIAARGAPATSHA